MKTRMILALDAVAAGADKTSNVIDISGIYGFFVQWKLVGTITGNIVIQGSADDVDYQDISTTAVGTGYVQLDAQYYGYMKIKFARTSGTNSDTVTVKVVCKGS